MYSGDKLSHNIYPKTPLSMENILVSQTLMSPKFWSNCGINSLSNKSPAFLLFGNLPGLDRCKDRKEYDLRVWHLSVTSARNTI